ncbi:MAG: DUF3135 domain-containing protein [Gammaproteobacteria bacterium]|nr:DUF3135 domain-containing protein [Gammaproteobacteria bacterium]MDH5628915.1 DUF3135 domain-containing protein [Gammaproteobacteria bacterium]
MQKNQQSDSAFNQEFNFDEWKELYEKDAEAFEALRKQWIDDFISSAPEKYQHRLKGVMFKVDAIRQCSKTPLQSCIKISEMMHNSLADLCYFSNDLKYTAHKSAISPEIKNMTADILTFDR